MLDEVSRRALDRRRGAETPANGPADTANRNGEHVGDDAPEATLWAALLAAPADGVTVPELMIQTGMSRPWIYQRLAGMARNGHAAQVTRGRWRAVAGHPQ